jgi:L-seryl-tRNA(Ser) seleniumtransferase
MLETTPRSVVVNAVRRAIAEVRDAKMSGDSVDWGKRVKGHIDGLLRKSLRPVINATGVILHTNLGRAPLADAAVEAIREIATGYSNLEYDLESGARGSRYDHCVALLCELTGAQDAIVVNNCASALILSLSALARGREVIVSRGELIEIGGSFRVPDIMERSGATIVEVGTTNRTHLDDYRRAISSRTGAIARIHRSNFAQSGFVADVDVESLASIASEHGVPIVHDLGSGLMIDLGEFGLSGEPTAADALRAGANLVLMSGDKLLGGPQAGIVLGEHAAILRLRKDPFARAMRVDKLTIAALAATLELYRDRTAALGEIPALRMISASAESVRSRCERVASELELRGIHSEVVESAATVGAGAFPVADIPSFAVALSGEAVENERRLRAAESPVVGRISEGRVLLDLRSVPPADDGPLTASIISALE